MTYAQAPSGNHGGKILEHKFIVMHYTATDKAAPAIAWLRTPASKASAHVVVDTDGTVTQLVPFDTVAWHAGASFFKGFHQLNQYSIGIELVNPGPVSRLRDGVYAAGHTLYGESEVTQYGGKAWVNYPEAQLVAASGVCRFLLSNLGPQELTGHEFVCVPQGRKQDPGIAFPWHHFSELVYGAPPPTM